jgi:RNA polymerase sigma factor (sigma-70 family)
LPFEEGRATIEDDLVLRDDQEEVIEALRDISHRQRDCLVLRYYHELGIEEIASTLGLSPNSVKTHLRRGLAALGQRLAPAGDPMSAEKPARQGNAG